VKPQAQPARHRFTLDRPAARAYPWPGVAKWKGTWKSNGPGQIEFGPLALTRARCREGSLHDRIVKHWGFFRSYPLKDGHLFLSLMADGGTNELEPATQPQP
jgi:hypothetical protein